MIGRLPDPSATRRPAHAADLRRAQIPRLRSHARRLARTSSPTASCWSPRTSRPASGGRSSSASTASKAAPRDVADPKVDSPYYHRFAVRLAEQGFVTFAPQNPYIGEDRFRLIQRKAHPLEAVAVLVHPRPAPADPRMARRPAVRRPRSGSPSMACPTAARPPCASRRCSTATALSICSADFNEWVWKTTSVDSTYSYMFTQRVRHAANSTSPTSSTTPTWPT